jgi:hypothetical protein
MFEQDWILRQIHEMTKIIAHVMFNSEVSSTVAELPQEKRDLADDLINRLKSGKVQEAVGDVNRLADDSSRDNLILGLEFYSSLSDMDEDFLEANGYSLFRARKDFEVFAEKFGVQQMTELYFGKDQ